MFLTRNVLLTFFILFSTLASAQDNPPKNCSDFVKGKLRYLDTEDTLAYIVIDSNKHIEYHNNGQHYIKSTIQWVTNCEYNMTMTEITIPDFPFQPGHVMNVKITKIEGDIIHYTSTVMGVSWAGRFKKMPG